MNNNIKKFLDESAKINFTNVKARSTEGYLLQDVKQIGYNLCMAFLSSEYKVKIKASDFFEQLSMCGCTFGIKDDEKPFVRYNDKYYSVPVYVNNI